MARLYATQLAAVQDAITALVGGAASADALGVTYSSAQLESTLYPLVDILSVKTAIEAIEQGDQAFQIGPRSFTKADLQTLYARRDALEQRRSRATRGGARVRLAVPLG